MKALKKANSNETDYFQVDEDDATDSINNGNGGNGGNQNAPSGY